MVRVAKTLGAGIRLGAGIFGGHDRPLRALQRERFAGADRAARLFQSRSAAGHPNELAAIAAVHRRPAPRGLRCFRADGAMASQTGISAHRSGQHAAGISVCVLSGHARRHRRGRRRHPPPDFLFAFPPPPPPPCPPPPTPPPPTPPLPPPHLL